MKRDRRSEKYGNAPKGFVKAWARVVDKRARDGARYLQMQDEDGITICVIEVMEMGFFVDQAAICRKMAELLTEGAAK